MLVLAGVAWAGPPEAAPREEVLRDWLLQDYGLDVGRCFVSGANATAETAIVTKALAEAGDDIAVAALKAQLKELVAAGAPGKDGRWRELYVAACEKRRAVRLKPLLERCKRLVFAKHYNMGGSHYAYTEGESDAQAERHFVPGTALCVLELDGIWGTTRALIDDPNGVIRDPDVSYDGQRVLFAWKKSDLQDDYHLYEMDAATGAVRQLTDGLGFADYEGVYLPSGDILFNSTRCLQIVDCWWTEVSNLYTCDANGKRLRRLGFDQVHTNFPQVLGDGRVVYTRWDYNDRGQIFPQPLFQMNPDGTGQTEFYGNNSWFPTTLIHARGIPGTDKVVAIATGHHSDQSGKLVTIDRNRGQEENAGVQLVAPVRDTPAVRVDAYGQEGAQFGYPYALSEREFIVTYAPADDPQAPAKHAGHFGIYFMDADGNRELLAWDAKAGCTQALPLAPRPTPPVRPNLADPAKTTGVYYLQDIYAGPGLKGVPRGTIKKLRVVTLDFRAAGIRANGSHGPGGGAMSSTPVSIGQGAWDVKTVLGDADVHPDGSACFEVPAQTPVYFQALDDKNRAVQTMRTWSTLQPGEHFSCVGCHEPKTQAPLYRRAQALANGASPQKLSPFHGPPRGFSFIREIQPILDRNCITCHSDRGKRRPGAQERLSDDEIARAVRLKDKGTEWQYTTQNPGRGWEAPDFDSAKWAQGLAALGLPGTPALDIKTLWNTPDIWARATFEVRESLAGHRLAVWVCHDEDIEVYLNGALAASEPDFVVTWKTLTVRVPAAQALHPGTNTIAVHCHQTTGGEGFDLALLDLGPEPTGPATGKAFSLLGDQTPEACSGRKWSDSYLALTNAATEAPGGALMGHPDSVVQWVGVQSVPEMIPPYFSGSARSGLLAMLENGHHRVKLNREEFDKLACWIDLNVPYCGDYREANCWTPEEVAKYEHFLAKRQAEATREAASLR